MALGSVSSSGICAYTRTQTDQQIRTAIDAHDNADASHPDIRISVAQLNARLAALELKFNTNVTKNSFSTTFGSLDGLAVTGVWNESLARIEF